MEQQCWKYISIHALLAESDRLWACSAGSECLFLSTLSLRRATAFAVYNPPGGVISIHALLAESDGVISSCSHTSTYFYPRSPCGERQARPALGLQVGQFLSTLSLRRATRTGRRDRGPYRISIHALLAESDWVWMGGLSCDGNFYPRSPCGERPGYQRPCERPTTDFYPRSPCGERLNLGKALHSFPLFLSTLSLRRATTPLLFYLLIKQKFLSTLSLRRATASQTNLPSKN